MSERGAREFSPHFHALRAHRARPKREPARRLQNPRKKSFWQRTHGIYDILYIQYPGCQRFFFFARGATKGRKRGAGTKESQRNLSAP